MSVARRKDGRWICKYKEEGVWKQRAFRTEEEAQSYDEESKQKEAEYAASVANTAPLTLGELALLYYKSNDRHIKTRKLVIYCLCGHEENGRHINGDGEFLREKVAETLTRRDLEQLRDNYRAHNASNNTINHLQAHIRAILAWGADQELISHNPWRDFKRLPVKKTLVSVAFADLMKVYECAPEWLQWAIKTAFCLCLRPGIVELFRLQWSAFDFRRGIVRISQGKTGAIKTVVPPEPYLKEAYARFCEDESVGVHYVCTRNGKVVYAYHKDWEQACKAAGIKMRPYDIRHLAASEMLAGGADLAAVAAQLGHASVTTTGKTYAHVLAGGQARAANALPVLK